MECVLKTYVGLVARSHLALLGVTTIYLTESILLDTLSIAAAPAQRKTVLLVHPDGEVDHLLNQVITEEGWDLQRAADNTTALLLAEANPFDLIITREKTSGREDVAFGPMFA
jgi:hypothetical protein